MKEMIPFNDEEIQLDSIEKFLFSDWWSWTNACIVDGPCSLFDFFLFLWVVDEDGFLLLFLSCVLLYPLSVYLGCFLYALGCNWMSLSSL